LPVVSAQGNKLEKVVVHLEEMTICIINDYGDMDIPLIELRLKG